MIREARKADIKALIRIENRSFEKDKFTARSLSYLVTKANATTLVDEENGLIRGYALILYNKGTSLARLYSLVVDTEFRGQGIGSRLLEAAEKDALDNECVIMRLEVRKDNTGAIRLYRQYGYKEFDVIDDYYRDHEAAFRFEKSLVPHLKPDMVSVPFYRQTVDFTCGPAVLLMAMKSLNPELDVNRKLELRIWRESTTIFMTSGHGGCSPFGLALSAYQRGFDVEVYVNDLTVLFMNSVRDPQKKEVMRLVQEDQLEEIAKLPITVHQGVLSTTVLQYKFMEGSIPIVLISSFRIYHEKNPHWVVVTGFDERYIYVHDSYVDEEDGKTDADSINMPILKKDFERMSRYGKAGQKAVIILSKRGNPQMS